MKKTIIAIVVVLILLVVLKIIFFKEKVDLGNNQTAKVHFDYNESYIDTELSADDFESIMNIFQGKKLYKDNPSCGFSKEVCIVFQEDQYHLCIARDECPIIYLEEKGKYFSITDDEYKTMREILQKYGMSFPCL